MVPIAAESQSHACVREQLAAGGLQTEALAQPDRDRDRHQQRGAGRRAALSLGGHAGWPMMDGGPLGWRSLTGGFLVVIRDEWW